MYNQQTSSFQDAIDVIESLPEYQQEDLINIIYNRLTEKRRETLTNNIREAREEYSRGEIKKGAVEHIMKEIIE